MTDRRPRGGRPAAAALALLAVACGGDPTGPGGTPSDLERANEEFAAIRAELVASTDLVPDIWRVTTTLEELGALAPPLPADLLGATLEWDPGSEAYVTTDRDGAPPDGLRFLLHASGAPPVPPGFLDVTDDGGSAGSLDVRLEKEGVVRLDYAIVTDSTESGTTISAEGFVTGGPERVDFSVAQAVVVGSEGFQIDLDYTLDLAGRPLSLVFDYTLDLSLSAPSVRLVATFVDSETELVIELVQFADNSIDGTVTRGGAVIATIVDAADGRPVFLDPAGDALGDGEGRAIRGLFDFALDGGGYLQPFLIVPADRFV